MPKTISFNEIGTPDVLTITEQDMPSPKKNEVQVAIKATGLNRAEYMYMAGQYLCQPTFPSYLGIEGAGVVNAIGSNVKNIRQGDEVCITPTFELNQYGVLGELMNLPQECIHPKPKEMDFETAAATFIAYLTSWGGLVHSGGLRKNDGKVVLITAASSSTGLSAIQIANDLGATTIATTRTDVKVEKIKAQNPDYIIVTENDDLALQVMASTNGHGADIIYDCVAGRFIEKLADAAAYEAVFIEYGSLSMEETPIPFLATAEKALTYKGFHVIYDIINKPDRLNSALGYLLPKLESGTLVPIIDKVFPFEESVQAYKHLESNNQFGKIVIKI